MVVVGQLAVEHVRWSLPVSTKSYLARRRIRPHLRRRANRVW
jgi:hypothetical protein